MDKFRTLFRQKEFHLLLLSLCLVLFNWPFLTGTYKRDLPTTFVSLFLAWAIVICLLFFTSQSYGPSSPEEGGSEETED